MKRETLREWQRRSVKMDYRPTRQEVQTLIDSHLEALKLIEDARSKGWREGYDDGYADADNNHYG